MGFITMVRVFLVLAALLFLNDTAAACSCAGIRQRDGFHPCMAYSSADAVFTGVVTEISFASVDANGEPVRFSEKVVHFSIDEVYRGIQGPSVQIFTHPNAPSCGYDFKQGERYFVYARREKDGKLTEWLCGPTVPLDAAARDLAYARAIKKGESGARIGGAVVKYEHRDIKDYGTRVPLSGIEVVLEQGDERVAKTTTDAEGQYEFRGLAAGTYRVRAALPSGARELSPDAKPKDHCVYLDDAMSCGSDAFILTNDSSIKGRLVTPNDSPLPQQYLALIPLDEKGKEISSSLTPSVSSLPQSGNYYFRAVPPGRYLLAVNPRNKPGKSDPTYPLMYYPGVMSRERARVIEIAETSEINLEDFKLTPPLKERWFSGTVLLADKSPAAGATVILIDPNDRMMETNVTEVITDERGRFRVKGYETFPYWIDAYLQSEAQPNGGFLYASPVRLSTIGSVEGVELVISLTYRAQPYHK